MSRFRPFTAAGLALLCLALGSAPLRSLAALPPAEWRAAALQAFASHDSAKFADALTTGATPAALSVPAAATWTGTLQIPALPAGGMLTFTFNRSGYTLLAETSDDSTNGTDGNWSDATPTLWMRDENTATRLQKINLAPSDSPVWLRIVLTNPSATVASTINDLELHAFAPAGPDDYWLSIGASITSAGTSHPRFKARIRTLFGADRDPVIFNLGISGTTTNSWLTGSPTRLEQALALHPRARYVLLHLGGNNVTANRPYVEDAPANTTLAVQLEQIIRHIHDSGRQAIPVRISFRDYKTDPAVNAGANPENGSLPYNLNIIDPLIARLTPAAFDPATNLPRLNAYQLTLDHQDYLSPDGIHLTGAGVHAWTEDLLATLGGPVAYAGSDQPPGFLREPADLVTFAGREARFSVLTQGPAASIEWLHNGAPIPDATGATLTIPAAGPADTGVYQVRLTAADADPVLSREATLTLATGHTTHTILLDTGTTAYPSPAPAADGRHWNNLTGSTTGTALATLLTTDGTPHPAVRVIVATGFSGTNASGTTTATADIPAEARRDNFYVSGGATPRTGRLQFLGLDPAATYHLSLFGSRNGTGNTRVSRYAIAPDGPVAHLNAADNIDQTATLADLTPQTDGTLTLEVSPHAADGTVQDFAYLSHLTLTEEIPAATPYAIWTSRHRLDAADAAPELDPDHDGLTNRQEYVFGLDPLTPSPAPQATLTQIDNATYLTLDTPLNPDATDHIVITEVSDDLETWQSGPAHTTALVHTPARYIVRDNLPLKDNPKRFMRIVTIPYQ